MKTWFCHKCKKEIAVLGMPRHRRMHLDKKEQVVMTDSKGKTWRYFPN